MTRLYTIGYSGWKPEQLKAAVGERGALLWDIRYSPRSRAPQWRREALRELLGTRYEHVPALGNRNYNNDGPIVLAAPEACLNRAELAVRRGPLILMCGCKEHGECHRKTAAEFLADRFGLIDGTGLPDIEHLYPPKPETAAVSTDGYYPIPHGEQPTTCKSCGAAIVWTRTAVGKAIPLDLAKTRGEGGQREALTHFATCEHGRQWSKGV
jgi:hypothetical protein